MLHKDLTINHRLESWIYVNAAARTSATGFVSGDIGRIAYQSDNGSYWRLISTTPTWQAIFTAGGLAVFQTATIQSPPGTTGAAMMGLGTATWGGAVITPISSGKVLVSIGGTVNNTSTGGVQVGIRYGTGAAPSNGAAAAGTAIGPAAERYALGANLGVPFTLIAVITGLNLGTPIWIDALVNTTPVGGTSAISFVTVTAVELP